MKKPNRVIKNGSPRAAVSQSQSSGPCIALFPEGDGEASEGIVNLSNAEFHALKRAAGDDGPGVLMFMANAALEKASPPGRAGHQPTTNSGSPSRLCFFDAGVGELAGQIPLVGKELPSVVVAAYRQRITVDQFIADAIKEKLGEQPSAQISKRAQVPDRCDIYDQWELIADKSLAVIQDLQEAYWNAIDKKDALETSIADGRISLALDVMQQIQEHKELTEAEHRAELRAFPLSEQRPAVAA
jgi:hypothetical protein